MSEVLHTQLVRSAHSYTRSEEPWRLEEYRGAGGATASGTVYGWKLFHYLSGGGMRAFGRTLRQDIRIRRQNRFLVIAALFAALWLALLVM